MKEITLPDNIKITLSDEDYAKFKAQFVSEPVGRWKPNQGQTYFLALDGYVTDGFWEDDEIDNWRYNQGNCFKTKEEAEAHKAYLEAAAIIRNSSSFVADWASNEQEKWYVYYDHNNNELCITSNARAQTPFTTYYESEEAAQQAAKTYEKEYLLVMGIK